MEMIRVGEEKINLYEKGKGPKVIMVHGIPTDYRAWAEQMDVLSLHYRTISYSRRCAYPNLDRDYVNSTIDNNVKDLEGLIKYVGGGPVHLIGHSYGGAIAARLALKSPDLVRSLVLIEPYLLTMLLKDPKSMVQNLSLLIRKPSVALSWRKAMKNNDAMFKAFDNKDQEKALQLFLDGLQNEPDTMKQYQPKTLEMMRTNIGTVEELRTEIPIFTKEQAKRITQPTLLITGERTIKVLQAIVWELQASIPNHQMVTIRNAAHMPHIENQKEFNEAVMKFLSELPI